MSKLDIVTPKMQNQEVVVNNSNFLKSNSDYYTKRNHQKIVSVERGFNNADASLAISNVFPKGWLFKPWDLSKNSDYYQAILLSTESVTFKHFYNAQDREHSTPSYTTCQIQKVIHPSQWGQELHSPKFFPSNFKRQLNHCSSYSYWDYQQAWHNSFFIQNQKNSHS